MSLDRLKLLAIENIVENTNLRKETRKYLMRYIKEEAPIYEIKQYLMDGYISSNFTESEIKQINRRFKKLNEFVRIGTAQITTTLGQNEVDDLKENYENCKSSECGNLGGKRYDLCKARCKLKSLIENRELLEDASLECDNTAKYPESCKSKISKSLDKLEDEITKTRNKISSLENLIEQ